MLAFLFPRKRSEARLSPESRCPVGSTKQITNARRVFFIGNQSFFTKKNIH